MIEWITQNIRSLKRDPVLLGIVFFVLCGHGYGLYILSTKAPVSIGAITQKKKIIVQTVKFKDTKRKVNPSTVVKSLPKNLENEPLPTQIPPSKPIEKIVKTYPPKAKPPSKPIDKIVKTSPPKAKPSPKPTEKIVKKTKPDIDRNNLLLKAKESIAKIDQRSDKLESTLRNNRSERSIPDRIETLSTVSFLDSRESKSSSDRNYRDQLASRLRNLLQLPDYGDVEINLSVSRDGKVIDLKIVKSESSINSRYVEKILPEMAFLPFGNSFDNNKLHTFHITLTNE